MPNRKISTSYGDYIPLPNDKARRYVDKSTGEIISNYSYRKNAIRVEKDVSIQYINPSKKSSHGPIQPQNKFSRYNAMLDRYVERTNRTAIQENTSAGKDVMSIISRGEARTSAEFKSMYRAYKNSKDRVTGGARWQALVDLGILDEDDDYY